jgi:hypothetical protein
VASKRHTIQVDHHDFLRRIERERRDGRDRAAASGNGTARSIGTARRKGPRLPGPVRRLVALVR